MGKHRLIKIIKMNIVAIQTIRFTVGIAYWIIIYQAMRFDKIHEITISLFLCRYHLDFSYRECWESTKRCLETALMVVIVVIEDMHLGKCFIGII